MRLLFILFILLLGSVCAPSPQAQTRALRAHNEEVGYQIRRRNAEAIKRAEKYIESLNRLLVGIQNEIEKAEREVERHKTLYQQGVIGKSQFEESQKESQKKGNELKIKLEETRLSLREADSVVSEVKNLGPPDKGKLPYRKSILLQVLELNELPMKEIITAVLQRGVGFRLTPKDEQEFISAGASFGLINAIRASYQKD